MHGLVLNDSVSLLAESTRLLHQQLPCISQCLTHGNRLHPSNCKLHAHAGHTCTPNGNRHKRRAETSKAKRTTLHCRPPTHAHAQTKPITMPTRTLIGRGRGPSLVNTVVQQFLKTVKNSDVPPSPAHATPPLRTPVILLSLSYHPSQREQSLRLQPLMRQTLHKTYTQRETFHIAVYRPEIETSPAAGWLPAGQYLSIPKIPGQRVTISRYTNTGTDRNTVIIGTALLLPTCLLSARRSPRNSRTHIFVERSIFL